MLESFGPVAIFLLVAIIFPVIPLILSRLLIFRPLYQFLVANELLSMGYGRRRYD